MSSLYNMGNLTAVKEVFFFFWGGGEVEWGMHKGVVVVGVGMGGGVWLNPVDGPAIFRSEKEVSDS